MDIRIQGESLEGANAPQTSRTQETPPAGQSDASASQGGGRAARIRLKSRAFPRALGGQPAGGCPGVRPRLALAALYARGNYQVDARNLSRALVSHALSGVEGDEA